MCQHCVNGACVAPNNCSCNPTATGAACDKCKPGWTGPACNVAICANGCEHGTCSVPGTCDCLPRWQGALCNNCVAGWTNSSCQEPVCTPGCRGICFNPNECACPLGSGTSGTTCNVATPSSASLTRGLGKCHFPNITTMCELANGRLDSNCPSGYNIVGSIACKDIPGFYTNVCSRTCCDGWSGVDCLTRLFCQCD